jgi:hypothetical protein
MDGLGLLIATLVGLALSFWAAWYLNDYRLRRSEPFTADVLEPLVTKAMGAYTEAVFKDNYRGFQERFIAEFLAHALMMK